MQPTASIITTFVRVRPHRSLRVAIVLASACAMLASSTWTVLLAPARAETSAAIAPSLSPDRLGAKAALTVTIHYNGGEFGVPTPVSRSVLEFPAGLSLDIPSLHSCAAARLMASGPGGCPAQSEIGTGSALAEVHAGSLNISEEVTLWAFLGPPHNLQPTFEILAQGYTPVERRMVLTGTVLAADPPYGEELVMAIPPIPTLALEPDASIVTFSLTIGASAQRRTRDTNAVVIPSTCPVGGFPFAGEFSYAGGASDSAVATAPCPR